MENNIEKNNELPESFIKPFTELLLSDSFEGLNDVEIVLDEVGDIAAEVIPVVRAFLIIGKKLKSVQAKYEWKNQVVFLRHVKNSNVNGKELEKRNKAYQNKERWVFREVEALVIYLSKNTAIQKAVIQAELYIDYINGNIDEDKFMECLDITHHLFLSDIPHLIEIYDAEKSANLTDDYSDFHRKICTKFDIVKCRRLMSNGLLIQLHPMSFAFSQDNHFIVSNSGKYYCEILSRLSFNSLCFTEPRK